MLLVTLLVMVAAAAAVAVVVVLLLLLLLLYRCWLRRWCDGGGGGHALVVFGAPTCPFLLPTPPNQACHTIYLNDNGIEGHDIPDFSALKLLTCLDLRYAVREALFFFFFFYFFFLLLLRIPLKEALLFHPRPRTGL